LLGVFLLCFLKGSDSKWFGRDNRTCSSGQEKRPRYLRLQKATAKTSEFRQLNQVRFVFDTLVCACLHLPSLFHSVLCVELLTVASPESSSECCHDYSCSLETNMGWSITCYVLMLVCEPKSSVALLMISPVLDLEWSRILEWTLVPDFQLCPTFWVEKLPFISKKKNWECIAIPFFSNFRSWGWLAPVNFFRVAPGQSSRPCPHLKSPRQGTLCCTSEVHALESRWRSEEAILDIIQEKRNLYLFY
jgi:hypothetical protein